MGKEQDTRATVKGIAQWVLGANFSISGEDRVKVDGFARKLLAAADNTDVPVAKLVNAAKGLRTFLAGVMPTAPVSAPAPEEEEEEYQPYYAAFLKVHPEFRDGGSKANTEFMLWMNKRWTEFYESIGWNPSDRLPDSRYPEFEAWLTQYVSDAVSALKTAPALKPKPAPRPPKPKGGDGNLPTIPDPTAKLRAVQTALDAINGGGGCLLCRGDRAVALPKRAYPRRRDRAYGAQRSG